MKPDYIVTLPNGVAIHLRRTREIGHFAELPDASLFVRPEHPGQVWEKMGEYSMARLLPWDDEGTYDPYPWLLVEPLETIYQSPIP